MTCFFGKDRAKAKSNHGTTSVSVEAAEAQARLAEQRSAVAEAQKREAEAVAREAAAQAGKMEAEARAKDAEARADKLETGMHEAEARAKDAEAALKAAQTSVQAAEARSDELMLELRQKTARLTQLEQQLEQAKQSRTTVSDSPRQPTAKDVTATLSEVRKEDLWEELRSVSRALSESKQATAKATERAKASETRASILEAELAAVQLAGPAEEEGGIGLGHLPGSDEEDDLLEQSWREALAPQQDVSPDLSLNRCGYTRSLEEEELEHLRLALENHAETALRDSVEAASKLTDAHHRIRELEEDVARLQAEKLPHEVPMQSWADLHPGPSTERIRPMSLSHLRSSTGSLADARQMLKADEDGRLSARVSEQILRCAYPVCLFSLGAEHPHLPSLLRLPFGPLLWLFHLPDLFLDSLPTSSCCLPLSPSRSAEFLSHSLPCFHPSALPLACPARNVTAALCVLWPCFLARCAGIKSRMGARVVSTSRRDFSPCRASSRLAARPARGRGQRPLQGSWTAARVGWETPPCASSRREAGLQG